MIDYYVLLSCIIMLAISLACCFKRVLFGPSLSDRILGIDVASIVCMGLIVMFSLLTEQPVFIDIIFSVSIVLFLTTAGFTKLVSYRKGINK